MSPLPRVDVGIITWNTRDLTLAAIARLREASHDVDLRVLLRDNGSSDGTADAVRSAFPDVEVDVGDNVGFAAGVNTLLDRSDAPWFVTLNSDAWPEDGALRRLVDVAVARPRAAAVAPLLLRPDGSLEHSTHALPSLRAAALSGLGLSHKGSEDLLLPGSWAHDRDRPVGWAVGAALLLRREALEEVGPWDSSLFMYAEDLEWCWRASDHGWQVWFTPSAVVRHIGNASGAQRYGARRELVAIQNANDVVGRHLRTALAWRVLNALGAARSAARARARGDRDLTSYWWQQVPAHLGRRTG